MTDDELKALVASLENHGTTRKSRGQVLHFAGFAVSHNFGYVKLTEVSEAFIL